MNAASVPETDHEGFLRDRTDWNKTVAQQLADLDDIQLTQAHWQIIDIVRDYYSSYHISPVARVLVTLIKRQLGPDKGRSIYLMSLFPGKPAKLLARIAGLPKPSNCD
ncbi:MAG: TusE/DsrC/DsvC family sulfur relay protein [Pseudomonadales bacterium]|nr:TusE/DsrC/DsvC family sulfur relay protein [Pseudomonadales bacterium]